MSTESFHVFLPSSVSFISFQCTDLSPPWLNLFLGVLWMQLTLPLSPGKPQILPELDFLYVVLMPSLLILAFIPSS